MRVEQQLRLKVNKNIYSKNKQQSGFLVKGVKSQKSAPNIEKEVQKKEKEAANIEQDVWNNEEKEASNNEMELPKNAKEATIKEMEVPIKEGYEGQLAITFKANKILKVKISRRLDFAYVVDLFA